MKMLGYICIALGMLDFGLSFNQIGIDLEKDLKETNDLADSNSTIIKKVEEIFLREHVKSEIDRFRLGYIDEE